MMALKSFLYLLHIIEEMFYRTNNTVLQELDTLPFAKLNLFSLLQSDKLPPDKGVVEGVHICRDE